ncbi:sugar phosphate nucleotidyltransferase [Leptolyngbya sp. FACHB-261]|uniref:sugar phosphate nucleotidyltransferase n=1 Tax=Leptolyngbya sp. FACHB-261 TaxID=2692806 RepID=UPI0016850BB3|nr:sugar phosphate nucleotidyltransferase [Leptolyngbya sp. FACHB-261]MBD2100430.1 NTP transferase domain-containing protein [Leptolyngbya sp. FACHB-261]
MKATRALIPLAGLASRLHPATRVIPKALLPIPGPDGSLRPAVDWIVREAVASGIDEVVLIISPRDGDLIRHYFEEPPSVAPEGTSSRRILAAWEAVAELARQLIYVEQPTPGGFGDAVLQAQAVVGSEPFVLLLGDHLYRSHTAVSCVRQVLNLAEHTGQGVLAVSRCGEAELSQRGVIGVQPLPGPTDQFKLTEMHEKPTPQAVANLRISGTNPPQYFCLFGIYLLPARFMADLAAASQQQQGELDLSGALQRWISRDGGLAYEVAGESFDIGMPDQYRRTVIRFSEPL